MQVPRPGDASIGLDLAAARTSTRSAFDAAEFDVAGSGMRVNVARAGQRGLDITAPGLRVERSSHVLRCNVAAPGLRAQSAPEVPHAKITEPVCAWTGDRRPATSTLPEPVWAWRVVSAGTTIS